MERALLFAASLVLVSLFALIKGGAPERSAATLYLSAYGLSAMATQWTGSDYFGVQWVILGVDFILFLALVVLACMANRYWGLWAASFQLIAVIAHLAVVLFPQIGAQAYAIALLVWSYAMLPLLAAATYRHQRRLREFGDDPAWVG